MNRVFTLLLMTAAFTSAGSAQSDFKYEFQDVCGSPEVESQLFLNRTGIVTRIVDGDSIKVRDERGKIWKVELAGADATNDDSVVRAYLTKTILGKR